MAFIPRPNIPEGLYSQLAALRQQQADPMVALAQALSGIVQSGIGAYQKGKERELTAENELQKALREAVTKHIARGGGLAEERIPQVTQAPSISPMGIPNLNVSQIPGMSQGAETPIPGISLESLSAALGIKTPYTGKPMKLTPPLPKPGQTMADIEAKREFENKRRGLDLEIKKAQLELIKGRKSGITDGKSIGQLLRVRSQLIAQIKDPLIDDDSKSQIEANLSEVDKSLSEHGLPGFGDEMLQDLKEARDAVTSGLVKEDEAQKRLSTKYPGLGGISLGGNKSESGGFIKFLKNIVENVTGK